MAAPERIVIPRLDGSFVVKLKRPLKNPAPMLRRIGAVVLAEAQRAFREQKLGDIAWAQRYPNQAEPFVNIAGVVADFRAGKKNPPKRRFDRRPAGIDTSQTLRSLTPAKAVTTSGLSVTVGSNTPGASNLQYGGRSSQQVTQGVKDLLAQWMKRERLRSRREWKKTKPAPGSKRPASAAEKMGFLFRKERLVTKVKARPFLGVTPAAEGRIVSIVQGSIAKGGTA